MLGDEPHPLSRLGDEELASSFDGPRHLLPLGEDERGEAAAVDAAGVEPGGPAVELESGRCVVPEDDMGRPGIAKTP